MTLRESDIREMTDDLRNTLAGLRLNDFEKEEMVNNFQDILKEYRSRFGEDAQVQCRIQKRFTLLEVYFSVKGERWNVYEEGVLTDDFNLQQKVNSLSFKPTKASYFYFRGTNVVIIRSPFFKARANILKQPLIWAMILGVACGLICKRLPQPVSGFIVSDLATPVLNLVLGVTAGVMGPIVFLSLVTAINTLEDINELNNMGTKLLKRFLLSAVFTTLISLVLGILLFGGLAKGSVDFSAGSIIDLILGIIPTSLVMPFVTNNIPQLMVLGIAMGAVLLLLGKRTAGLAEILQQMKEWLYELLNVVLKLTPAIPFLSLFKIVANGEEVQLLKGWKFLVGIMLGFAAAFLIKLIRVCVKCRIRVSALLKNIKPLASKSFATGSEYSALKMFYEISREDLGMQKSFVEFWVPMSQAMLSPSTSMRLVMSAFYIADLTDTPVSLSFLLVLTILAVEMSLASPGFTAGCTILFSSLGISSEYVGVVTAFNIFTRNIQAAYCVSFRLLEEIEAASALNKLGTAVQGDG